MACSIPLFDKLLHKLGYAPACGLHDAAYEDNKGIAGKLKADTQFMANIIRFVPKWYSYPLAIIAFAVLSTNPISYYLYIKSR